MSYIWRMEKSLTTLLMNARLYIMHITCLHYYWNVYYYTYVILIFLCILIVTCIFITEIVCVSLDFTRNKKHLYIGGCRVCCEQKWFLVSMRGAIQLGFDYYLGSWIAYISLMWIGLKWILLAKYETRN